MRSLRLFLRLVRWDLIRELRRREAAPNMVLFGVLVLFLANLGIGPLFSRFQTAPDDFLPTLVHRVGAVLFWVAVIFAGTVGLAQTFAADREGDSFAAVVVAPVDLGVVYLAKVASVWLWAVLMEAVLLLAYLVLFGFDDWAVLPAMATALGAFTLAYEAVGVVLAAMTSALRGGGEVVLRILLFPLLLPVLYLTLGVREATFGLDVAAGALGPPLPLARYLALVLAFAAIYLTVGFLMFPKIFEE